MTKLIRSKIIIVYKNRFVNMRGVLQKKFVVSILEGQFHEFLSNEIWEKCSIFIIGRHIWLNRQFQINVLEGKISEYAVLPIVVEYWLKIHCHLLPKSALRYPGSLPILVEFHLFWLPLTVLLYYIKKHYLQAISRWTPMWSKIQMFRHTVRFPWSWTNGVS